MRRAFLGLVLLSALAACADDGTDAHEARPGLADSVAGSTLGDSVAESSAAAAPRPLTDLPGLRSLTPLPRLRAMPLADVRLRVVARDVRYEVGGAVIAIDDLTSTVGPHELTVLPTRFTLARPDRPRLAGTVSGRAFTDDDGVRGNALFRVGSSSVTVSGLHAADGWRARLDLRPLAMIDAHALDPAIPPHGIARGTLYLAGSDRAFGARTPNLELTTDSSTLRLVGGALRGRHGDWAFDSLALVLDPVHPDDWTAWMGATPPIDAPLRGRLIAHGSGASGVDVHGGVDVADETRGFAATVDGTLWLEPRIRVDLRLASRDFRLAGMDPLDVDLDVAGTGDSLAVRGSISIPERLLPLERGRLRLDAVVLRSEPARSLHGTATVVDSLDTTWLTLRGSVPLGDDGLVDVTATADSLPLRRVSLPSAVRDLRGYARVHARASGRLEDISVEGDATVVGLRLELPEYGTGVDSARVRLQLREDRLELTDVRAFRGGGALTVTGDIRFGALPDLRDPAAALEGATIDLVALLDTMTIVDMDSARAVGVGRLTVTGPLERPHVAGRLDLIEGRVFEGRLAPHPPLDPDAPPYLELVARAPWPAGRLSRLARPDLPRTVSSPPLTADVVVRVAPGLRIVDEDSDLGARGSVRIVVDEHGVDARGDAGIVDGFYAYYGYLFQLVGGAFAVDGGDSRLAMSGALRGSDRPLGKDQGGADGLARRDPAMGIFGYSTPAIVLELLRYRTALPATQPQLAALLLFDVPPQPVDTWDHGLAWRGDDPAELIGHRSAIQGAGLLWSYIADELYDYLPLRMGNLRAGTIRIGSRYPGWIMLGTRLAGEISLGDRLSLRSTYVVGGGSWPSTGLRYALRESSLQPADRHLELFNEPRFLSRLGAGGTRDAFRDRRRTGMRVRWQWDY